MPYPSDPPPVRVRWLSAAGAAARVPVALQIVGMVAVIAAVFALAGPVLGLLIGGLIVTTAGALLEVDQRQREQPARARSRSVPASEWSNSNGVN